MLSKKKATKQNRNENREKGKKSKVICFISHSFVSAFLSFIWPLFLFLFLRTAFFPYYHYFHSADFNSLQFCFDFDKFLMNFRAATVFFIFRLVHCDVVRYTYKFASRLLACLINSYQ